eukprot:gene29477-36539_t
MKNIFQGLQYTIQSVSSTRNNSVSSQRPSMALSSAIGGAGGGGGGVNAWDVAGKLNGQGLKDTQPQPPPPIERDSMWSTADGQMSGGAVKSQTPLTLLDTTKSTTKQDICTLLQLLIIDCDVYYMDMSIEFKNNSTRDSIRRTSEMVLSEQTLSLNNVQQQMGSSNSISTSHSSSFRMNKQSDLNSNSSPRHAQSVTSGMSGKTGNSTMSALTLALNKSALIDNCNNTLNQLKETIKLLLFSDVSLKADLIEWIAAEGQEFDDDNESDEEEDADRPRTAVSGPGEKDTENAGNAVKSNSSSKSPTSGNGGYSQKDKNIVTTTIPIPVFDRNLRTMRMAKRRREKVEKERQERLKMVPDNEHEFELNFDEDHDAEKIEEIALTDDFVKASPLHTSAYAKHSAGSKRPLPSPSGPNPYSILRPSSAMQVGPGGRVSYPVNGPPGSAGSSLSSAQNPFGFQSNPNMSSTLPTPFNVSGGATSGSQRGKVSFHSSVQNSPQKNMQLNNFLHPPSQAITPSHILAAQSSHLLSQRHNRKAEQRIEVQKRKAQEQAEERAMYNDNDLFEQVISDDEAEGD